MAGTDRNPAQAHMAALRAELDRTKKEMNSLRLRIDRAEREENQRLTGEIRRTLSEESSGYRRAFDRFQSALSADYDAQMRSMQAEYDAKIRELNALHADMRREGERLRREAEKISSSDNLREVRERAAANTAVYSAAEACRVAERLPTERFFPNKLQLFLQACAEAKALLRQKLYTHAAAVANAASLNVKELQIDTETAMDSFRRAVSRYQTVYESILALLKSESAHRTVNENGDPVLRLSDAEIDYWSGGLYGEAVESLREHAELLARIRKDPANWLKHECSEPDAIEFIREKTRELTDLPDLLEFYITVAFRECESYESVFRTRRQIDRCLADQNYVFDQIQFGPCINEPQNRRSYAGVHSIFAHAKPIVPGTDPDYREERRLIYRSRITPDRITIRFLPERNEDMPYHSILLHVYSPLSGPILQQTVEDLLRNAKITFELAPEGENAPAPRRRMTRSEAERILAGRTRERACRAMMRSEGLP